MFNFFSDAVEYKTPIVMEDVDQITNEFSVGCWAGSSEDSRNVFDRVVMQNSLAAISDIDGALQTFQLLIRL